MKANTNTSASFTHLLSCFITPQIPDKGVELMHKNEDSGLAQMSNQVENLSEIGRFQYCDNKGGRFGFRDSSGDNGIFTPQSSHNCLSHDYNLSPSQESSIVCDKIQFSSSYKSKMHDNGQREQECYSGSPLANTHNKTITSRDQACLITPIKFPHDNIRDAQGLRYFDVSDIRKSFLSPETVNIANGAISLQNSPLNGYHQEEAFILAPTPVTEGFDKDHKENVDSSNDKSLCGDCCEAYCCIF